MVTGRIRPEVIGRTEPVGQRIGPSLEGRSFLGPIGLPRTGAEAGISKAGKAVGAVGRAPVADFVRFVIGFQTFWIG